MRELVTKEIKFFIFNIGVGNSSHGEKKRLEEYKW